MQRRRPARLETYWLGMVLLWSLACERPIEGAPCPCVEGVQCCGSDNVCHDLGPACLPDESVDAGTDAGAEPRSAGLLPRHCNESGFCGARYPFSAVWGSAADDVWATAQDPDPSDAPPALLHWNGTLWQNMLNPSLVPWYRIHAISGSADQVWFVGADAGDESALAILWAEDAWYGSYSLPDVKAFRAVWSAAADDVWAVGTEGGTGHWDGSEWFHHPPVTEADLNAIWGASKSDAWAAGNGGTLLHYDGNAWTPLASDPMPTRADLHALWGRSATDVWAAGADATILHFDGERWSPVDHGLRLADASFTGLSGNGQKLWLASSDGRLLGFDGSNWSEAPSRARAALRGVWSAENGQVWSVGDAAESLHWDGTRFHQTATPSPGDLFDVWGSAPTDLWAVGSGGQVWHGNGASFVRSEVPASEDLFAVHGSSADDVWAVGSQLLHYEGSTWSLLEQSDTPLRDVIAFSPQAAWAVGDAGLILRWDGETWSESARFPQLTFGTVWGGADDDVWALDVTQGAVRWNGSRWDEYLTPGGVLADASTGQVMTGTAVDDMWLVTTYEADDGTWCDYHLWTGQTFQSYEPLPLGGAIRAGWPAARRDFWLVGQAIWRFQGGERQYLYRGLDVLLNGVWASGDDVWAVGSGGTILHREPVVEADFGGPAEELGGAAQKRP